MTQPQQDPDASAPDSADQSAEDLRVRDVGRRLEDKPGVQSDMALRSSEARFRALVDGIHDYAIFMAGPDGHVSSWNRGAARIFGYKPNEIIGQHLDAFHQESDSEVSLASEHLKLAELFGRFEEEGWRVRKDGRRFWSQGSISALFDDSGLIGFAVVVRDLTERREAEEALHTRSEQLAAVVHLQQRISEGQLTIGPSMELMIERIGELIRADGIAVGILEGDEIVYRMASGMGRTQRGERFLRTNSLADRILTSGEWVRADDAVNDERLDCEMCRALGIGSTLLVPLIYDGEGVGILSVVYAESHAIHEDDIETIQLLTGQIAAAVSNALSLGANVRLIRERTEALEEVKRSEERFRSLIEHASDCIAIVDAELRVKYASPSHERTIGYSCSDLENMSLATLVHPDDVESLHARMQVVLAAPEQTASCEIRLRHRLGAWRSTGVVLKNLLDHAGIDGIILTLHDVTERNMLEAQLRQSQKMDAVGQLAGGVAHDFNNLLTVIKGNLELLTLDLQHGRTNAEIEEIRKAADRAAGLTRQLLAFSRKQLLHARATDVNEIVTELEPMLRRLIGNDVQVAPILAPNLTPVLIDPSQMHQVLMNLAVNARDAMPGGGVLIIETSMVEVDERYLEAYAGVTIPLGSYVQISVSDDGVGMSEEVRARLFEPFFTTKDAGKGSGLGLATVYGIVKQSGGFVWATSEPGVGSTFQVLLPSAAAGAVAENAAMGVASEGHGSETILLVEDEEPLRKLAKRVLERYGYRVLTALNGQDAKRIVSGYEGAIDLLLTDVVMPGTGGRELADWFQHERPDTRLLYMSGYTDDEIIRRGLNDPSLALLEKPFSPADLVRTVRQVLDVPSGVTH